MADVKAALAAGAEDMERARERGIADVREVLSRRGRAARRKGQQSERDIAALVRRVFPDAKRGIGQARFGRECPDVDGTPYWIETKCGKNAPVRSALKQAVDDTDGRVPVVIVKDDRCEPFVVMRLSDWLEDLWQPDALLEKRERSDDGQA